MRGWELLQEAGGGGRLSITPDHDCYGDVVTLVSPTCSSPGPWERLNDQSKSLGSNMTAPVCTFQF